MKSFIASLRELTLPFGATSGTRIVLDGINGVISVYDANGVLVLQILPEVQGGRGGVAIYDDTGDIRGLFSSPYGPNAYVGLQLSSGQVSETNVGLFTLIDWNTNANRVVLAPGERASMGALEFTMLSAPSDNSRPSMIQVVALTLDDAGNLRPIIDLTGAAAPASTVRPITVVHDIRYGTPNNYGIPPTMVGSYPRGVVAYYMATASDAARAAGFNTNAKVTFDASNTRLYRVSLKTGSTVGTAAAPYALELNEGGTVGNNDGTTGERFGRVQAADTPAGSLNPFWTCDTLFAPTVNGSTTLLVENSAGSGGTMTLTASAQNRTIMWVEDIGLQ